MIDDFLSPHGIVTQKRQLDEELGAAVARIAQQRQRAEAARRDNEELAARIEGQQRRVHDLQVDSTRSAALRESLTAECEQIGGQIGEQQNRRGELARDEQNAAHSIAAMNQALHDLESRGERLAEQETGLRARLAELDGELQQQSARHAAYRRTVQQLQDKLERSAGGIERLQLRDTEVATEIRTTLRTFQEIHAQDLSQYELDITQSESRSELRATLARLREEVRQLGQVNLMAAEQFREVNERYQFLRGQLDDLETATRDLSQIAEQIHAESSTLFRQAFADIRREFQGMFRRLFGGGRTELKLTDPEALLESGIEFYAQPPGKKLENITLLSGGERALTAVALLFALYRIRPSPFCILDEIDAAPRRRERRPAGGTAHRVQRRHAVSGRHPQQAHRGRRLPPVRPYHGGARRIAAGDAAPAPPPYVPPSANWPPSNSCSAAQRGAQQAVRRCAERAEERELAAVQ